MLDPCLHPRKVAQIAGDDVIDAAVNDGGGIPFHHSENGNHVAIDFGMRTELHIADHRDHVAIDFGVDVGITDDRDRIVFHRARDSSVSKDRDDIHGFTGAGRGAENRHHGIRFLPCR
jgi:hypothetical protein